MELVGTFQTTDLFIKIEVHFSKLEAGGKPSTWLPPGRLVEHYRNKKNDNKQHEQNVHAKSRDSKKHAVLSTQQRRDGNQKISKQVTS